MKIGKFKVSRELVFRMPPEEHMGEVFRHLIPVKIEWDFNGVATYTAISSWFDEVEDSIEPPEYKFMLTTRSRGTTTVEVQKIE